MQENKAVKFRFHSAVPRIFAVLLLMTLISCHIISGTLARYVTAKSSSDFARVASFSVSADDGDSNLSVSYPAAASYTVKVKNESEVAVSYTVKIVFDGDVSSKLSLKLENVTRSGSYSGGKTTYTWSGDSFRLCPNNADGEQSLSLSVSPQTSVLPGADNKVELGSYSQSFSFDVQVTFEQIIR